MRALSSSLLLSLLVGSSAHALTVEEAEQQAIQHNLHHRQSTEQSEAARDQARSVRGRMGFAIRLNEEFQHYNGPFALSVTTFLPASVLASLLPPGTPTPPPIVARDQNTNTFSVSAAQPLLGLLKLSHNYLAQSRSADAASLGNRADEARVVESVRTGFLRYFEAVASEQIAASSENELGEQVRVNQSRLRAGVITTADLLRVQVARANARQQKVAAHAQAEIARATLIDAVGLSPEDDSITLEEPKHLLEQAARSLPDRAGAVRDAIAQRPELKQAQRSADAAVAQRRAAIFEMLPDVDAEFAYARVDGQLFAPTNSYYGGVKASWAIWEWGAGYYAARAQTHQANIAKLSLEDQRRQIVLEVQNELSQLAAAAAAVEASQEAIDSANEAYRVTARSVEAGTATTTDLLDAQSALTTARLNLTRSRYEQAMARVTFQRLIGENGQRQ
jgi:outer membrane protein TolC